MAAVLKRNFLVDSINIPKQIVLPSLNQILVGLFELYKL